ncbi:MAG: oxidoreductase [Actinobacteria bacterium]|nr:oxidoreductase [Actinomycetota bacterium]
MARWHLVIDVERCEDCNNCFLACKDEHVDNEWPGYAASQPRHGQRWIDILRKERGRYPLVDAVYLPVPCMHCDDAPCVAAGGGAVRKREDGIVLIDPVRTQGMSELPASCPYGAIFWNEEAGLPQKCTLCAHLLDQGWRDTRCTQACPTGALRLVEASDMQMQATAAGQGLEALNPEYATRPRVLYKNLSRWDSHLVCGSVSLERDGLVECAAGATVELYAGDPVAAESATGGSASAPLSTAITDAFGDFRIDGLVLEPGGYSFSIALEGYAPVSYEVDIAGSCNVGTIRLQEVSL